MCAWHYRIISSHILILPVLGLNLLTGTVLLALLLQMLDRSFVAVRRSFLAKRRSLGGYCPRSSPVAAATSTSNLLQGRIYANDASTAVSAIELAVTPREMCLPKTFTDSCLRFFIFSSSFPLKKQIGGDDAHHLPWLPTMESVTRAPSLPHEG